MFSASGLEKRQFAYDLGCNFVWLAIYNRGFYWNVAANSYNNNIFSTHVTDACVRYHIDINIETLPW